MRTPKTILMNFIKEDQLDIKSMVDQYEMDFQEYYNLVRTNKVKEYAFYSVKSRELVRFNSTLKIRNLNAITFQEGTLSTLFTDYVDWVKIQRFTKGVRNRLDVELKDKNIPALELFWFSIDHNPKFLITNFLQTSL